MMMMGRSTTVTRYPALGPVGKLSPIVASVVIMLSGFLHPSGHITSSFVIHIQSIILTHSGSLNLFKFSSVFFGWRKWNRNPFGSFVFDCNYFVVSSVPFIAVGGGWDGNAQIGYPRGIHQPSSTCKYAVIGNTFRLCHSQCLCGGPLRPAHRHTKN